MAITMTIGGVDYTEFLRTDTLKIQDSLNQRNTASFTLQELSGAYVLATDGGDYLVTDDGAFIGTGVRPSVGAEVVILNGATTIFAGTIDGFTERRLVPGGEAITMDVECVDFNELADRFLVAEAFETPGQTLGDIVTSIVTTYLTGLGITTTGVQDGPEVLRAVFNYQKVSEAFNDLAELTGYSWNIDYDKVLHFFSRETNYAPFDLTESSLNYREMVVSRDRSQYRNKQYVRAGTDLTSAQTEPFVGDGTRKTFNVKFPVGKVPTSITVNGVSKTIGIRGVDDETAYDWYWSKGATEISQKPAATALTAAQTLSVTYQGQLPVNLTATNDAEIAARGTYEAIEDRPNIDDQDLADATAEGLLRKYARIPVTVEFETDEDGLFSGQLITITVPSHDLSGRYLIDSVAIRDLQGKQLRYRVRALDGESLGGWEEFFRQIVRRGRTFVIRDNEVLLLLRNFTETVTLTDTLTPTTATTAASKWVVGTSVLGLFEI